MEPCSLPRPVTAPEHRHHALLPRRSSPANRDHRGGDGFVGETCELLQLWPHPRRSGRAGVNIASTVPNNQYSYMSGTSMAAPHVTGIVGLLASVAPNLTAQQMVNAIVSSADPILNLVVRGSIP